MLGEELLEAFPLGPQRRGDAAAEPAEEAQLAGRALSAVEESLDALFPLPRGAQIERLLSAVEAVAEGVVGSASHAARVAPGGDDRALVAKRAGMGRQERGDAAFDAVGRGGHLVNKGHGMRFQMVASWQQASRGAVE